jgi:hypothetical protein
VQAALATGRGPGVDAVVTGGFPSFFRSCHDSPHVVCGSLGWLLFWINQTFGRCTHI